MSKMTIPPLTNGSSARGAQMGRRDWLPVPNDQPVKLSLRRLRFVDGAYDQGGAYWGAPANLWRAVSVSDNVLVMGSRPWSDEKPEPGRVEIFVRADSREEARKNVQALVPNARFFR